MCNFKTLHIDEKLGYVLQCVHCGDITIGFSVLVFTRSLPEFYRLMDDIQKCYAFYNIHGADPAIRNIPFWELNNRSCMTLSLRDLHQLGELLDLAYSGLLLENMLTGLSDN